MEQKLEKLISISSNVLPHVARGCLCATFMEDSFRMINQWSEQKSYIKNSWNCPVFVAQAFVAINFLGQLVCSLGIMGRRLVHICCYILFGIILMQCIGYNILSEPKFLMRSLSLAGAVLLILAETRTSTHTVFDLPTLGGDKPKSYLQLSGRIMLILMFASLVHFSSEPIELAINFIGILLICLVAVGFKTKLVSIVMVLWLFVLNIAMHDFWNESAKSITYDFKKYDFFQTLTVIGGLLQLIIHGPGTVSIDESKKSH